MIGCVLRCGVWMELGMTDFQTKQGVTRLTDWRRLNFPSVPIHDGDAAPRTGWPFDGSLRRPTSKAGPGRRSDRPKPSIGGQPLS